MKVFAALYASLLGCAALAPAPAACAAAQGLIEQDYGGRSALLYLPARLPAPGERALVVVLHGGLGNAHRIASAQGEGGLNLNAEAEAGGFIVAYLNGTAVTRRLGKDLLGWNAGGGCCGQAAERNVDDVAYVSAVVEQLAARYGIARSRVFGTGHSNGAMMSQRLMCETGLYAAVVAVSGPLNTAGGSCGAAAGRRILAIHGEQDENVPLAGGRGKGISGAVFQSEQQTGLRFGSAGATFSLQVLAGVGHRLDQIDAALRRDEGQSLAQKTVRFFGLSGSAP